MPIKLSDLLKRTRVITVEFQGETVTVTYRLNAVTPALLSGKPSAVEQVKAVVEEWDVLDDRGRPMAPDVIAEQMPTMFLEAVLSAVVQDMQGGVEKKG